MKTMSKFIAVAAAAVALATASAASAATFTNVNAPAADGTISGTFGNHTVAGDFTDIFDFTLPTGLTNFTLSSTTLKLLSATDVSFSSVKFNGVDFDPILSGLVEFRTLNGAPVGLGGPQHLVVTGHAGASGSYDGTIAFSPVAVPEPATWGLMIMGFGGMGAVLRRRRQATAFA